MDEEIKKNINEAAAEIEKILKDRGLSMVPTLTIIPAKEKVIEVPPPSPILKPGDDILMSTDMYEGPGDPIGNPQKGGILD